MTTVALVLAGIAAALHVYIWTMESITWKQPATWKRFGVESQEDADTQALFAYNQGYYNLFLAAVAIAGIVLVVADRDDAGWALVIAACGSMFAAALVLLSSGGQYARAAATQGIIPALAVLFSVLALA
jgi:putative membrane protein